MSARNQQPKSLLIEPLSATAFAAFGEVIAIDQTQITQAMNAGSAHRYANLAQIDCATGGGTAVIGIVHAIARQLPMTLNMLERHPLGTQAFIPLGPTSFMVIVALSPQHPPRAFLARNQGISYHRGCWHHALFALADTDFLVVDRVGPGDNCEEAAMAEEWLISSEDIKFRAEG